ncbi:MAG: bifunctional homocysteine S-methyltransferase/methylenetetrahydrofolate reductase [Deltaproteobacteria bacterium]|nr:MAG: bifunctional homocysteine S-methyltransferase/methylenetetrahydrofolate reductase [Deltaproteobacteria bacterium]
MSEKRPFLSALKAGALVFDGAMGTALYERGLLYTRSLDAAVLDRVDAVKAVYEGYVLAGANVLTTNTFGANAYRLEPHGLADQVQAINHAAVDVARAAAGPSQYIAGSIGPTGLILKTLDADSADPIRAAFREQAAALSERGIDVLVLETFRQPEELELAIEGAKAGSRGAVPIIASCSFDTFGTMADGTGPEKMAGILVEWGADAIGVNCADGPAGVYEMASRMLGAGVPVVAQPNAGLPHRVEGRFAYKATPEYFQIYARRLYKAGIHAVGGCCGTTPDHIKKIASAARMVDGGGAAVGLGGGMREDRESTRPIAPGATVVPLAEKSELGAKLGKKFVISVEVNPPPGLSLEKAMAGAKLLRDGGVDVINVADGPRASARMGNLALCARIQNELGMPALMHVTTRDRNLLGLVAHLLAAHEFGVNNLVVITGDPPKMGDFPDATAVYDTDSIGLLRVVNELNHGFDPGGKPIGAATAFLSATGAEPAAKDYDRELSRLQQKIDAGAEVVMTQPVYDPAILERFLADTEGFGVPVLVGILPLASYRNAEFLHNEVPGMQIPEAIRDRMRVAGGGPTGRAAGVEIAREMLSSVKDRVAGAYIMPPFGRYALALEVIDGIV